MLGRKSGGGGGRAVLVLVVAVVVDGGLDCALVFVASFVVFVCRNTACHTRSRDTQSESSVTA